MGGKVKYFYHHLSLKAKPTGATGKALIFFSRL